MKLRPQCSQTNWSSCNCASSCSCIFKCRARACSETKPSPQRLHCTISSAMIISAFPTFGTCIRFATSSCSVSSWSNISSFGLHSCSSWGTIWSFDTKYLERRETQNVDQSTYYFYAIDILYSFLLGGLIMILFCQIFSGTSVRLYEIKYFIKCLGAFQYFFLHRVLTFKLLRSS